MKRRAVILYGLALGIALAALFSIGQASQVSAGALPCFLCHGFQFEGSDIAPRVAGTQLTDAQILKQIRTPRGLMPAFPDYAQDWIVEYIRSVPTGQPTKTFSQEERSAALATIAAVAAARATAVLQNASGAISASTPASPATPIATPLPLPSTASPASAKPGASTSSAAITNSDLPLGILATSASVLVIAGALWLWQRPPSQPVDLRDTPDKSVVHPPRNARGR